MTPITEDQVLSLMKGAEVREKNVLLRLARSVQHQNRGAQMTARILKYKPLDTDRGTPPIISAHPVALDEARAARKARRTVHGHFFYTLGAGLASD